MEGEACGRLNSVIEMAFRGRGRGRGRGGRGGPYEYRIAKHEPFIIFPEDVNLPSTERFENLLPDEKELIHLKVGYERFIKGSCYYLKDSKREEGVDDIGVKLKEKRRYLNQHIGDYMKLNVSNFPNELIKGTKRERVENKKIRWERNQADDFGFLEKLEEMYKEKSLMSQGEKFDGNTISCTPYALFELMWGIMVIMWFKDGDEKANGKKKEDHADEQEEMEEEEEEESSEDDDYAENEYFDDDEDDFNMDEEPEEDCYE
ncbi:hypothetical protein HPP92_023992 [Vanilla planifolia]|uniref:DNA-directed RNA polymerase III subunit n=1 Tax=Vanilla planifolia TaxID=51239 RepID=A0A835PIV8_VANPL|nr:hypothetical protein HPP92_023992 [Vanilla planifolia]